MSASKEARTSSPVRPERDGDGGAPPSPPPRRRLPIRPGVVGSAAVAAVVVAVVVWLFLRDGGGGGTPAEDAAAATSTAQVERRDLVETESVDGTLGYAGSRGVLYAGPGVAAKGSAKRTGSGSSSNAAYVPSEPEAIAVAYRQDTPAGPTGDELPVIEGSTDPGATTDGSASTTTTDSATTEPAPTEPATTEPAETGETTEDPETGTTPPQTETEQSDAESSAPEIEGSTPQTEGGEGDEGSTGAAASPSPSATASSASAGGGATDQGSTSQGATALSSSAGGESATVTWLPAEGEIVERGDALFRANGKATLLLYGATPAWRTLRQGTKGVDVRQLEQNLVAMGYGKKTITVDNTFGAATKRAVKQWQDDLGVDETGVVKLGMVTFLPAERRVDSVDVALGDQIQVGQQVLTTSSTRQVVTVDLDASDQALLAVGDAVTIELPDGSDVAGTVDGIGTVASSSDSSSATEGTQGGQDTTSESSATVPVTIVLDEGSGIELDQAPVDVEIASESAENVLAVPVTALLALAGGGYAVEIVDEGGLTHLVRVDPGMYADGYVEIEGEGIEEGTTVVVPA